jgi:hypothetical protein
MLDGRQHHVAHDIAAQFIVARSQQSSAKIRISA